MMLKNSCLCRYFKSNFLKMILFPSTKTKHFFSLSFLGRCRDIHRKIIIDRRNNRTHKF